MHADAYDLAVIGGGIAGCTIAYEYARMHPSARVALFERARLGGGCSGFAGALASPAVRTTAARAASDASRNWYGDYAARHGDAPLERLPILYVVPGTDAQALAERLPPAEPVAVRAPAWLTPGAGDLVLPPRTAVRADVAGLCRHMLAGSPGIDVFEGTPVRGKPGPMWELCLPDGRTRHAARLVHATGPWMDEAHGQLLGARRKKIVAFMVAAPVPADAPVVYFAAHESFLLPLREQGCWLLSVRSAHWDCAPPDQQLAAAAEDLVLAQDVLSRYAPSLLGALRGARVHCDYYVPDMLPRAVADTDGAVLAGAGSGSGFRYAPALAHAALQRLRQPAAGGNL